jgi:hypothetical protein
MLNLNPAILSKINWTQVIAAVATVTTVFGFDISPALQLEIVTGIALATNVVTMIWRTFFTGATPAA